MTISNIMQNSQSEPRDWKGGGGRRSNRHKLSRGELSSAVTWLLNVATLSTFHFSTFLKASRLSSPSPWREWLRGHRWFTYLFDSEIGCNGVKLFSSLNEYREYSIRCLTIKSFYRQNDFCLSLDQTKQLFGIIEENLRISRHFNIFPSTLLIPKKMCSQISHSFV